MFYQGSLQEGISTAVGQQKLVLCFVTSTFCECVLYSLYRSHLCLTVWFTR